MRRCSWQGRSWHSERAQRATRQARQEERSSDRLGGPERNGEQASVRAEKECSRLVYCILSRCLINSGHGLARPRSLSPMGGDSRWDRPRGAHRWRRHGARARGVGAWGGVAQHTANVEFSDHAPWQGGVSGRMC